MTKKINIKHRFRKKKSVFRKRWFWDIVLAVVFFTSLFYLLFVSPFLEFKGAEIIIPTEFSGFKFQIEKLVLEELDRPAWFFLKSDSWFLIKEGSIKQRILELYPEIAEVSLDKKIRGDLIVEIKKREPVFLWCYLGQDCFLADKDAVLFKQVLEEQEQNHLSLIFLEDETESRGILEKAISREKLEQILLVFKFLEQTLSLEVDSLFYDGQDGLKITLKETWQILLALNSELELNLAKLKLLLERELYESKRKNLNYVDLRFSKVYYK